MGWTNNKTSENKKWTRAELSTVTPLFIIYMIQMEQRLEQSSVGVDVEQLLYAGREDR